MDSPIIISWASPLSFLGAACVILKFYSDEIPVSKQNSGVTSGAMLFAFVQQKDARLI